MTTLLEESMVSALQGCSEAARSFFLEFLKGPLFVPCRFQSPRVEESVKYPDEFLNILGLPREDHVFVPAFSSAEMIEEWAHADLKYRSISGKELLDLLPENWWIWVNPGREVEKEITPWEAKELRAGEQGIPVVLEEIMDSEPSITLDIAPVPEGAYRPTIDALKELAARDARVERLFMAVEESENPEGKKTDTLLVCAEVQAVLPDELESLRQKIGGAAETSLIGSAVPVRVLAGQSGSTLTIGLFKGLPPIYEKKHGGFVSAVLKRIKLN